MTAAVRNKKPSSVVKFTRKRTGCKTCRDRHMRCDEAFAPDCGNCRKVGRFCDRTTSLAFRHFGLVEDDGEGRKGKRARRNEEREGSEGSAFEIRQEYQMVVNQQPTRRHSYQSESQSIHGFQGEAFQSENFRSEGQSSHNCQNDFQSLQSSFQISTFHQMQSHQEQHSPPHIHQHSPSQIQNQHKHSPSYIQSPPHYTPSPELKQLSPQTQPPHQPNVQHRRSFGYSSMTGEDQAEYREPNFSYDWQFPEMELELPNELFPSVSPSVVTGPYKPPSPSPLQQQQLINMAAAATAAAAARSPTRLLPESIEQHGAPTLSNADTMFLLRHFSTGPGAWNDLYDERQAFANIVPVRAVGCETLLKACLAMSSHHLAIVGMYDRWKAVHLYNEAIQAVCHELLRINSSRTQTPNHVLTPTTTTGPSASGVGQALPMHSTITADTGQHDEDTGGIACALVIMAQIEMSIAADAPWRRHLQGCRDFFVLRHITASSPDPLARAAFITHARMDTVSAIIASCSTLIPPSQWRVDPRMHCDIAGNSIMPTTDEGWASRITKILADILAFRHDCANGHINQNGEKEELPRAVVRERWTALCGAVEVWRGALPDSYRPVAVVPAAESSEDDENTTDDTNNDDGDDDKGCPFPLTWYPRSCVASAMYEYHAACILLLLSKPWHGGDMREAYKEMEGAVLTRSRIAVGICIANKHPQTWVNSPQYLYIAGKALRAERERRRLEALLREIEAETGWATEWRRKQLREEWTRG